MTNLIPKDLQDNFNQIKTLYQNYLKAKKAFKEIEEVLTERKEEFETICLNHFQKDCPPDKKISIEYKETNDSISLEIFLRRKSGFDFIP